MALRPLIMALALAAFGVAPAAEAARLIRDAEIERTIKAEASSVLRAAGLPTEEVKFFIVEDPDFNAVTPDGRSVAFNTGLLMDLATPEELMAVIAHEAGHMAGGHHARRGEALRAARGQMLVATILGVAAGVAARSPEVGAAGILSGQSISQRGLMSYSRSEESSADQASIGFLESARVDPAAAVKVLERLREKQMLIAIRDPYLLTHPLGAERIDAVSRRVEASPARGAAPDPDLAYWHARMRAKLMGFIEPPARTLAAYPASDSSEAARLARAAAHHKAADEAAAIAEMDALISLRPDDAYYHELKGQILFESGDAPGALSAYERAAALAPGEALIRIGAAQAMMALGRDAEARGPLEEALRQDDLNPLAWRLLSEAYGRLPGDENRGAALAAAAESLALGGDLRAAKAQAERAQGLLPYGSRLWVRAGDILALPESKN